MDIEFIRNIREAIRNDNVKEVVDLIGNDKEKLNTVCIFGSWLHEAAMYGYIDLAKQLLDMGIDRNIEAKNIEGSALTAAASKGQIEMIKFLRNNGFKYDLSTPNRNPLIVAIMRDEIETVKYLIDTGIDISIEYSKDKDHPINALYLATIYGKTEIVNILKEKLKNDK